MGTSLPVPPRHFCHHHCVLLLLLLLAASQSVHAHQAPSGRIAEAGKPALGVEACHNWFYRNFRLGAIIAEAQPQAPADAGISFSFIRYWGDLTECHPINRYACGLAMIYLEGEKVPQNFAQAAHWFQIAAQRGDPAAKRYAGLVAWVLRAQVNGVARPRREHLQQAGRGVDPSDDSLLDPLLDLTLLLMMADRLDLLPLLEEIPR